ncbi:phage tail protein [Tumebacillus permanentifrigoris]|uniref:Microcystin-dependent protein n=1 Tax=Tumebacillus permanentifrigoris TaxID=378543 RepID=A0A316DVW0_9BACL|nr:tail fiber protein [Tumebacillus permanentifrigoris]PWK13485.1 microcystin-dependent protein [Tumebacillus permanentifrigoris]
MSESYVGEIRMFAGNFAPAGWAFCDGSLMSISENEALFALLGTTYGGDGQTTFALPDLRGRVPIHVSSSYSLGARGGTETVTLTSNELPAHTHAANASATPGEVENPSNALWAIAPSTSYYGTASPTLVPMNSAALSSVGGNQPHDNMMPTLTLSYIISLYGIYPSQS